MSTSVIRCFAGEKLEAFELSFTENDDDALDISGLGFTAKATWYRHSDGTSGEFDVASFDASTATATVRPLEAMTATVGVVDMQAWVGNGTDLWGSDKVRFVVSAAAGTAPSI